MKKYTKERHIVFQEADVTDILIDYLESMGEIKLPKPDEIEFSYDKYKHGNEITLMFDEPDEPEPQLSFFSFPTNKFEDESEYVIEKDDLLDEEKVDLEKLKFTITC